MKCEWCGKETYGYKAYKLGEEYTVCEDCLNENDEGNICDICHQVIGKNKLTVIPDVAGTDIHVCKNCSDLYNKGLICDWCGSIAKNKNNYIVPYMGDRIHLCSKCHKHYKNGTCRKCGEHIDTGKSFNGICLSCEQTRADKAYDEQVRAGIDLTRLQNYLNMAKMDYADFCTWITGSWVSNQTGKKYNEKYNKDNNDLRTKIREMMISDLLLSTYGWTPEISKMYHEEVLKLFCIHLSKLISGEFILVANKAYNKQVKWSKAVDHTDNISVLAEYKLIN